MDFAKNYLEKYQNLLADEFQHFFFGCVYDKRDDFPIYTVLIDKEGRNLEVIGPDLPSKVMSVLYPTVYLNSDFLKEKYIKFAESYKKVVDPELSFGIVQTPFKLSAYRVCGDERVIKKLIFSEKLKGQKYLSLSLDIEEETFNFIVQHFKKWKGQVFYFPYMNNIHVVFKCPEKIESSKVSIYIEIGRFLKDKTLKKYNFLENSYKLPEMKVKDPAIAVFKVPADKILEIDFQQLYTNFIEKIEEIVEKIEKIEI